MKPWIKIGFAVALVLTLAGIGIGIYLFNLKPEDLRKVKPDFIVTAAELQQAFEKDENSASAKYINKIIEVTGTIESMNTGEENTLNITLQTGNGLSSVICTFPFAPGSANLNAGAQVTVRGECSGYLMDVLLNNCVLIK